ncbi:hypothetical protein LEP1GSC017_2181 [Leptospira meyeri serovar Hardjo str. Went 5]|nr:hypothetical protein LEP1GSC017_2181 [Leptospira meyeri serovar Hardjo str. Went 5]EMJ89347.1 hypothetical protein LEP1GSC196_1175 [Leptospira meyeri serovar Semaranga str. Veldrot Semarang 173]
MRAVNKPLTPLPMIKKSDLIRVTWFPIVLQIHILIFWDSDYFVFNIPSM